ncbi:MAG: nucleotidyltransferase domain-containing protein [Muribaculaceae bacterium]|nr:nucleotidyltransferase domain-containing protein [Muribaculaceae bacterium]
MSEKEKFNQLIEAIKNRAAEILPTGSRVALYGSRARGDHKADSDWDLHILIPGEERVPWSLWDVYAWPFSEIGIKFDEIINPRLYSISGWMKRSFLPFHRNVESDAIIIYHS